MRKEAIRPERRVQRAARLALIYVVLAAAWILLGDAVTSAVVAEGRALWLTQTLKGIGFVLLTGVLLFLLAERHERRLGAERAAVDLVLRQLPGVLWTTDRDLLITSVAGEIDEGGCDLGELVGRPVTSAVTGTERRAVVESGHRRALGGDAADYRVDLGAREFGVRVEPLRDETGRISGAVGFALELPGEGVDGEESVREAVSRSRWLSAVGALTLDVAHQIKNPLFAITAALDSFEQRAGDQPETARHRQILRDQAKRIERLVSGLQVYGRNLELEIKPVELASILDSAAARRRAEGEAAGVTVTVQVNPPSLVIRADREAIVDAVERVIRNAVEHSQHGRRVEVIAHARSDSATEMVEIIVLDRGPGFAEADLPRAFEPLFSRQPEGTGLGLAIAERIVRAHGGRITAANRDGGGAQVTLRLPR